MMNNTIFIHGAYSTSRSFNFFREDPLFQMHGMDYSYNWNDPALTLIEGLQEKIMNTTTEEEQVNLVGHSLGGMIAMAAAVNPIAAKRISAIVTIGSPLGGVEATRYLKWLFPSEPMFKTISPGGPLASLYAGKVLLPEIRRLHLVTCGGHSAILKGENDGVVTVDSQMAVTGGRRERYEVNHFEALLDHLVRTRIATFLS